MRLVEFTVVYIMLIAIMNMCIIGAKLDKQIEIQIQILKQLNPSIEVIEEN